MIAAAQSNFRSIWARTHSGGVDGAHPIAGIGRLRESRIGMIRGKDDASIQLQILPYQKSLDGLHAQRDAVDAYLTTLSRTGLDPPAHHIFDQTTDTNFERGQDDAIVRIRETYYQDTQEYILRIDVDAAQSAAAAPAKIGGRARRRSPLRSPRRPRATPSRPVRPSGRSPCRRDQGSASVGMPTVFSVANSLPVGSV